MPRYRSLAKPRNPRLEIPAEAPRGEERAPSQPPKFNVEASLDCGEDVERRPIAGDDQAGLEVELAALPVATYVLTSVGFWMLSMKSNTISALGEDYVTVAKARGLKESRITSAYVGRNAMLPMFTILTSHMIILSLYDSFRV